MRHMWRRLRTIQAAALAIVIVFCCSEPGFSVEARTGSYALSPSQKRYVKTNGYPEQFILLFISVEVDFQKRVKKVLPQPRRLEAWLYLTRERYVIFDNGYFAEEAATGVAIDDPEVLPPTDLNPAQFTAAITRADIATRYGKPDKVEPVKLGKHLVEVYRYLTPSRGIKSFTFFDQRLQSVVAGFAVLPKGKTLEKPQ
jgi:hypothetical protein